MSISPASPPRRPWRLTVVAQRAVAELLRPGDLAVYATAGNGHDTLLLARGVGATGRVLAFDVQPQAIANTRERLLASGLLDRVRLLHMGHEQLADILPDHSARPLRVLMFNLGYLPGGDKRHVTAADTTLAALDAGAAALASGGLISLMVYIGHPGGAGELAAVRAWVERLDTASWSTSEQTGETPTSPVWFRLRRLTPRA